MNIVDRAETRKVANEEKFKNIIEEIKIISNSYSKAEPIIITGLKDMERVACIGYYDFWHSSQPMVNIQLESNTSDEMQERASVIVKEGGLSTLL